MRKPKKKLREATLLQHGAYDPKDHNGSLNMPLYLDIAQVQPDVQTAASVFQNAESGFLYFRKGHQNARHLEKRLALLEEGESALVFSSGLAATNCLLLDLIPLAGDIVAQRQLYGGTFGVIANDLTNAGRYARFVDDPLNLKAWEAAINRLTSVVFLEMPSNPTVCLLDLEAIAKIAHARGAKVVVDNTFAPLIFKPLRYGADVVIRSGSKYENPGNTSGYGLVVGSDKIIKPLRNGRYERFGAPASAFDCWLAELGLRTLNLRMTRQSDSAYLVATRLDRHYKVRKTHYPLLPGSPYYALAQKYLPKGCGGILAFEPKGGPEACVKFMQGLKVFKHVVSLGDTRSLATYPALTTHSKATPLQRKMMGISDSLIRLSIGLEDPNDLIDDLEQALRRV